MIMECRSDRTPSSSMDSSSHPALSTTSSGCRQPARRRDLTVDLHLGLSLSSSSLQADSSSTPSTSRDRAASDWPPVKPFLRSALTTSDQRGGGGGVRRRRTLFVKVYMEGVPIGRKLDLLAQDGYHGLLAHLCRMFNTSITYPEVMGSQVVLGKKADHVLTYEDQEGDWMMVGDVPWELFLRSVKKLRIARADKC